MLSPSLPGYRPRGAVASLLLCAVLAAGCGAPGEGSVDTRAGGFKPVRGVEAAKAANAAPTAKKGGPPTGAPR
jgi:hypothetical protein